MIPMITEPPIKRGSDLLPLAFAGSLVTLVLDSDLRGDVGGTVNVHPCGGLY